MKRLISLILPYFILIITTSSGQDHYRYIENESFGPGEELKFRVHWKFINAAEAVMRVSDGHYNVNGRPCYKIDVYGTTTGLVDVMVRVRDNWGAYVDTASILPQKAYRYIEEGKYRKNEMINFDHASDKATVLRLDKKTRKLKEKETFEVPNNVLDIVGGYYFLRTLDYEKYDKGDIIKVSGFFDDEIYNLEVKFLGREELKTKLGTFNTVVIAPIIPENDFFNGKEPVKAWISDDLNKVPLKIQAELGVGALEIDIKEMNNLRN
ncbi:DUF3108 domain-containing protein [Porifericola rhodea]|uniref:DUF3108 domain-containing protein n=1 Tax=Porifericola rhodea TaxID=930972 RepID=UPI00266670EF|nr:DUF3108 domain-containing protein [Porifericola rhodea]WKN32576.1 DUF3108 domain-containing protein [Porifericola rhodea]